MRQPLKILMIASVVFTTLGAPSTEQTAQFLAGVMLLHNETEHTVEQKGEKFKSLQTVTGLSAQEALSIIRSYRGKPEKWKPLYDSAMKMLETDSSE